MTEPASSQESGFNPNEFISLAVVKKYLTENKPQEGFQVLKKAAEHDGWNIQSIAGDRRDRNVAKFIAKDKTIKIYTDGHSPERLLWELGHEITFGNLAIQAKSQPTREAGIAIVKRAIDPITDAEIELADHTQDSELSEALGDKRIYKFKLQENDSFRTKAAIILYEHQ